MRLGMVVRRFLVPRFIVTLYYLFRARAFVSPHAEVEISPQLQIGPGSRVGSFAKIKASSGTIRIGARVDIGTGCLIGCYVHGIDIGDDCLISHNVGIVGVNYRYDRLDQTFREQGLMSKGPIRIGKNVWLGIGVVVLDGTVIEDGVIVAPNSVVSGHIPANAIVQGNPAKVVFIRR